ncbi:MAG: DUF6464 family protein [Cyanobacteria bacterium P01_G01_bin.49]
METESLITEVILVHPHQSLGKIKLDWIAQPGNYLELAEKTYVVLERRHHYQYKIGGYQLQKVALYVQTTQPPKERTLLKGRWVVGDSHCRFNAKSEIFRCAVKPDGPCKNCQFFEPRTENLI